MVLRCPLRQMQPFTDLPVRQTGGNERSDLALAAGQQPRRVSRRSTQGVSTGARQQTGGNYVRQLLAALTETERNGPVKQALIEPLSERELDVLRLLGTELDGPAIARELMVSLHTVRTHTKHIYAKLAVTNRRAAVRRAQELDLVSRPRNRQP